jgi:hypothetical protein
MRARRADIDESWYCGWVGSVGSGSREGFEFPCDVSFHAPPLLQDLAAGRRFHLHAERL